MLSSLYSLYVLPSILLFNVPISLIIWPSRLFNSSLLLHGKFSYNSIYQSSILVSLIFWYNIKLFFLFTSVLWACHLLNNEKSIKYNYPVYKKIRETNIEDWYIELYEEFSCENKEQLNKREGQIIREIGTLNKRIEGRTPKEYRDSNKELISEKKENL